MENPQIKEYCFSSGAKEPFSRTAFYANGDLKCRMQCFEWSDGKLGCPHKAVSIVQKSPLNGKFLWYSDYVAECIALGVRNKARHYEFYDLREAYYQFLYIGKLHDKRCFTLLMEIIHAYNDKYYRDSNKERTIPVPDYKFFVQCIIEILEVGSMIMPDSLKAELYREAGMFSKCIEFDAASKKQRDEMEIIDEVRFRAARGDSKPFIIEQCQYYKRTERPLKRQSCIISDC